MTKYPFSSLAKAMCMTEAAACRDLGIAGKTQQQYRRVGMSEKVADRMAVKAGLVPYEVWPELLEAAVRDVKDADYENAKRVREYKARWARQNRQSNPVAAQANRERRRAYYEAFGEYERARQRRYRQANREAILARQRQYDRARRARLRATQAQPD